MCFIVIYICRWRRLCHTALSSGVGARRMITRLRGRLWGLQPPLFSVSTLLFSALLFIVTCSRNSVGLFRTVKHASAIFDNRRGSSVTNSTRSRETRANTRRSVSSSAQEGCKRARPSTLARAPPKSLKEIFAFFEKLFFCISNFNWKILIASYYINLQFNSAFCKILWEQNTWV